MYKIYIINMIMGIYSNITNIKRPKMSLGCRN